MAMLQIIICAALLAAAHAADGDSHELLSARKMFKEEYHNLLKNCEEESRNINKTFQGLFMQIFDLYDGPTAVQEAKRHIIRRIDNSHMTMTVLHCAETKKHPIVHDLNTISQSKNQSPIQDNYQQMLQAIYYTVDYEISELLKKQRKCAETNCLGDVEDEIGEMIETTIPQSIKRMQHVYDILAEIPYKMSALVEEMKMSHNNQDTLNQAPIIDCAVWTTRKEGILCKFSLFKCNVSKFLFNFIPFVHHHNQD